MTAGILIQISDIFLVYLVKYFLHIIVVVPLLHNHREQITEDDIDRPIHMEFFHLVPPVC